GDRVWFTPPRDIDPLQQPRPGGLAALTLGNTATGIKVGAGNGRADAPAKPPGENSVSTTDTRENSARKAA
ncbi:hypothetical protein, partial [Demequina sp.]|uniref:hypothetical protein n=1 Tax=Demequina sp. TaxID=2050685 RepID=UPI0025BDA03B